MKQIKFRAFIKDIGVMCPVGALYFGRNYDLEGVSCHIPNGYVSTKNVADVYLIQSTGLKDKNGVEIFEGDLVRVGTQAKVNGEFPIGYVVRANDKPEMFIALPEQLKETGERQYYLENLYRHYLDEFEVIGNVYENSDLLEATVNGH